MNFFADVIRVAVCTSDRFADRRMVETRLSFRLTFNGQARSETMIF